MICSAFHFAVHIETFQFQNGRYFHRLSRQRGGRVVIVGRVYLLIHVWATKRPSENPSLHSAISSLGREDHRKQKPEISAAMCKWLDLDMAISKLSEPEQETVARVCTGKQLYLPRVVAVQLKGIFQERGLLGRIQ
jgi:hypothetical protein